MHKGQIAHATSEMMKKDAELRKQREAQAPGLNQTNRADKKLDPRTTAGDLSAAVLSLQAYARQNPVLSQEFRDKIDRLVEVGLDATEVIDRFIKQQS